MPRAHRVRVGVDQGPDACDEHGRCYGGELLKVGKLPKLVFGLGASKVGG